MTSPQNIVVSLGNTPVHVICIYVHVLNAIVGELLPELITSLVLLLFKTPTVLSSCRTFSVLSGLLDVLDTFNRHAPAVKRDDLQDLAWPGVWSEN